MPRRTLQHNLAGLRDKGFLTYRQRGARSSNLYTLLDPLADQRAVRALRRKTAGLLEIASPDSASNEALTSMAETARRRGLATVNVVRARLGYTGASEEQLEACAELAELLMRMRGPQADVG